MPVPRAPFPLTLTHRLPSPRSHQTTLVYGAPETYAWKYLTDKPNPCEVLLRNFGPGTANIQICDAGGQVLDTLPVPIRPGETGFLPWLNLAPATSTGVRLASVDPAHPDCDVAFAIGTGPLRESFGFDTDFVVAPNADVLLLRRKASEAALTLRVSVHLTVGQLVIQYTDLAGVPQAPAFTLTTDTRIADFFVGAANIIAINNGAVPAQLTVRYSAVAQV
jgi:hypothetical protein